MHFLYLHQEDKRKKTPLPQIRNFITFISQPRQKALYSVNKKSPLNQIYFLYTCMDKNVLSCEMEQFAALKAQFMSMLQTPSVEVSFIC